MEAEYEVKTKKSAVLYEEAIKCIPLGVHSYVRFYKPYPLFVKQAQGTVITDVDGNEYIDFSMNYGAQMVGHAHPLIVKVLKEQVDRGTLYTIPHENSIRLAQEIIKRFPIEQIRFTNSGAEATMHALRLTRGYTGSDKIIKIGGSYHGAHDYLLTEDDPKDSETREAKSSSKGVPRETMKNILMGTFNDLDSVRYLFNRYRGQIAGVIVEPIMMNRGTILPEDGFLEGLKKLCQGNEALLIFDEVKTGVKIAWGGACEYYDIKPDIICLAKSIGGGLPIGAFGTSKEIMSMIESGEVTHAGTYNANPLSVRAGVVALRDILTKEIYEQVFHLNQKLVDGYKSIIKDYGLPAHMVSIGPCATIHFCKEPLKDHRDVKEVDTGMADKYWLGMLNQGVIPCPYPPYREQWTISVQHTEENIDKHIQAFGNIAATLKER